MSLQPGDTVSEYRVIKKIGEGGMGEVFLVVHQVLGMELVLKGLHKTYLKRADVLDRFAREAQAMARLKHPSIVSIYNYLKTDEGAFIAMEYVDGQTFDEVLFQQGTIPPGRAIELIIPILSAIEYAHGHGIFHRDLKPVNLILGRDGRARILDFGTAKIVDAPGLTRAGTTLGTAMYMAPEQLMGKELTPAADLYSLGVTLYEMLTGQMPFSADDTRELVRKIHQEDPVPLREWVPEIAPELEAVVLRCLKKDPSQRYQSARELADALEALRKDLKPAGAPSAGSEKAASGGTVAAAEAGAAATRGGHPQAVVMLMYAAFAAGAGALAVVLGLFLVRDPGMRGAGTAIGFVGWAMWVVGTIIFAREAMRSALSHAAPAASGGPAQAATPAPDADSTPRAERQAARRTSWYNTPVDQTALDKDSAKDA